MLIPGGNPLPKALPSVFDKGTMLTGITLKDERALWELAYSVSRKDAIFVEIGSWLGYSSSILGMVAQRDGGQVFCIDHWRGSPGVQAQKVVGNCLDVFRRNMEALELDEVVHPLVMESATAVTIFADEIADIVFIDADHRYESVKQDLELWWPKVKVGGILCGHDCEGYYSDFSPQIRRRIDETLGEDYPLDIHCHSGVIKALNDYFGHNYSIKNGTTIWFRKKIL